MKSVAMSATLLTMRRKMSATGFDQDPLDRLIRAGLATPPRRATRRTDFFPSIDVDVELGAMLEADRRRLDG
ncbi:hypothetical protein AOA12_11670 [Microbacterium sp. No. 7]|nr:hypothetical protein AOA12_11670 [Microbacterium sp. No. 7]